MGRGRGAAGRGQGWAGADGVGAAPRGVTVDSVAWERVHADPGVRVLWLAAAGDGTVVLASPVVTVMPWAEGESWWLPAGPSVPIGVGGVGGVGGGNEARVVHAWSPDSFRLHGALWTTAQHPIAIPGGLWTDRVLLDPEAVPPGAADRIDARLARRWLSPRGGGVLHLPHVWYAANRASRDSAVATSATSPGVARAALGVLRPGYAWSPR